MIDDQDYLALSGLQHFSFCERQWALIHMEQQWDSSWDTARGDLFHERIDIKGYSSFRGVKAIRSMHVKSESLRIVGIADIVEFTYKDEVLDSVCPVEYKVGKPKVEEWDRMQVCAQALCLEEMFNMSIEIGFLFYGETRRRETVELNIDIKNRVKTLAAHMHSVFDSRKTPPVEKTSKCKRCSLSNLCIPGLCEKDPVSYWNRRTLQ